MARETDYTVLYRASADFSALTREATKARAVLKAMREEEEKANKVSLQDQDRIEKARTRARKALEAQNMAATTSARISREMAERGKREAETVRDLARGSEVAARQINKLAEAYKKLNSAASGETTSSSTKTINDRTSFAAVSARELEKVRNNLTAYISAAKDSGDTNTRLINSFKNVKETASQVGDILARLTGKQKDLQESVTEVSVSTQNYGNIVETTTRRVVNAGTENERIITTVRRVSKELDTSGTRFGAWAGSVVFNLRKAWREAEEGSSVFAKLRNSMTSDGRGPGFVDRATHGFNSLSNAASHAIGVLARLPRVLQIGIGIATIFEPAVAALGALGAAALGAANNVAVLAGALAAVPGFFAAGATAAGALFAALNPVAGVFDQYAKAQQEAETASRSSSRAQRDNSQQVAAAARAQRNAVEGLADANRALRRAQQDLNEAWEEAKKDLQDLREEVERGSLNEERAEINLARAKENLLKVNNDLSASELDRREAALAVRDAEFDLAEVRRNNKETRDELSEAEKRGLAGSERVVRAQENLANAQRQVRNAELDLIDAKSRLAAASSGESAAAARATTQQDRYRKMLSELSPSTRKFVETILGMEGAWKKIQRATQESFFKHIVGDTKRLNELLPMASGLLTSAADALGKVADRGLDMITSGPWKADFKQLAKDNAVLIENMGDAGLSVADAFRHITMAAAPFTRWISSALKEGAASFASWAKEARENGSIARFLEDTKNRMQQMWQIAKNVGATLVSWNKASNDFGKWMLERLEAMTKRWRDNAKAQEENGSKLKSYLQEVRPLLSAIGALVGAVAKGFASIAADPENMASTIKLMKTLQNEVLPPLLRFLDELNESGIAVTVAEALGKIFDAFADFLDLGGGEAIATFVNVFSEVVNLFLDIYRMPVLGSILGGVAVGIAAIAGVAVAARFVGLFRLWDLFKWMLSNGRAVAGRFRDVGDGINSTTTTTTTGPGPGAAPGPGGGRPGVVTKPTPISASDLAAVQKNVDNYARSADNAATKTGFFARAMDGARNSAGGMRRGLGSLTDFLGGPWGVALTLAAVGVTYFMSQQDKLAAKSAAYESALDRIRAAYAGTGDATQALSAEAIAADPKLAEMVNTLSDLGLNASQIAGAFRGSAPEVKDALAAIDEALKKTEGEIENNRIGIGEWDFIADRTYNKGNIERLEKLKALRKELAEGKITNEEAARAVAALGVEQEKTAAKTEKLKGETEKADFAMLQASEKIKTIDDVLTVLNDTSSTTTQRFEALKTATDLLVTDEERAKRATEDWNAQLVSLRDSVKTNGKSLSEHTREGINNRKAVRDAADASRDHTLALIASGMPYDEAIKKHKDRMTELQKEAEKAGLSKKETALLIAEYNKIPGEKKTEIKAEGFDKVYQQLRELQWAQLALKYGMSPEEASAAWKKMEAARKGQYPQGSGNAGLKPRRAMGGPVYGPGSKTSDDIDAKLSNGEFVQRASAVDYYGTDLMYSLNSQLIDKNALKAAAAISSRKGGNERVDPMYAQGGHVCKDGCGHRFASGGMVFPMPVSLDGVVTRGRRLFNQWKQDNWLGGDGDGSIGGWKHMWNWVKTRFPFAHLASGYRPGDPLYHGKGKAIDVTVPDKFGTGRWWDVFRAIKGTFFKNIAELIWDFAGNKAVKNGREHFFTGPKAGPGSHADHIHWAMNKPSMAFRASNPGGRGNLEFADGGLVDLLNFSGLPSPRSTYIPRTDTSKLSQAAKSVVNNSTTNRGMSFGDVIIQNPLPERPGDSIRRATLKTAMLFDEP